MKENKHMKTITNIIYPAFAVLAFTWFALSPTAQGVVPAPDGGYPDGNTAEGTEALNSLTTGVANTAHGFQALFDDSTGTGNTATGSRALFNNTVGVGNTAVGASALEHNTGTANIGLGVNAGLNLTTGDQNIDIGNIGVAGESQTIRIGKQRAHTRAFVAGIFGTTVAGSGVFVNSSGQLGMAPSSKRFKDEIKPMEKASEAILALKPVTFRYKKELDPEGIPQFGLVAEEVEKINPNLIVRDPDGKAYTVRYEAVNAMLLNEFLKEHRKVEEQEKTIVELKSGMTALAATVKEQASQIQKVSAQLEASKPAPQVVNNP
jgi:Chaperone of endosialidase